jgi:putative membrane protein
MRALFKNKESFFTLLIILFFLAGLVFHLIPYTLKYVLTITDITMLFTNSIVLYFVFRDQENKKLFYWSVITFILTFLTELIGVRTGMIFGAYKYGGTMIIQLFNVPIVIGMNWVILMLGSYSLALMTKSRAVFVPLFSSLLIVSFDFLMEEVAMKLDYWQWEGNTIPFQNYVAWFFISVIFSSILVLFKVNVESRILKLYFLIQLVFFIVLRMFLV